MVIIILTSLQTSVLECIKYNCWHVFHCFFLFFLSHLPFPKKKMSYFDSVVATCLHSDDGPFCSIVHALTISWLTKLPSRKTWLQVDETSCMLVMCRLVLSLPSRVRGVYFSNETCLFLTNGTDSGHLSLQSMSQHVFHHCDKVGEGVHHEHGQHNFLTCLQQALP